MRISIQSDIASVTRRLTETQSKHVPFATVLAITRTAQLVKQAEISEMRRVFDQPTAYTLNSLFVHPATKAKPYADVFLKDDTSKGTPAAKYLLPQIKGGLRPIKRFERALQRIGAMPNDMVAVPGRGARFDQNGNMSRGQIVQILSFLRAFGEQGYRANRAKDAKLKKGQRAYFAVFGGRGSDLPPGVYQRFGTHGVKILPVIRYVKPPLYARLFRFAEVGQRTVRMHIGPQFRQALADALTKGKRT